MVPQPLHSITSTLDTMRLSSGRLVIAFAIFVNAYLLDSTSALAIEFTKLSNISYGVSHRQKFDVYLPPAPKKSPILFFIHGGAWKFGDKANAKSIANKVSRWVPKGFVFVSTNYRLVPSVTPYEQAQDILLAIKKIRTLASKWGADPTTIVMIGHSAGAHLAALVSASTPLRAQQNIHPWLATILIDSAAYDVEKIMQRRHNPIFDTVFGSDPNLWRQVSPFHQIKTKSPPILAICSTLRARACRAANALVEKSQLHGTHASVLPVAKSHKELNQHLGASSIYTDTVELFLKSISPNLFERLEH